MEAGRTPPPPPPQPPPPPPPPAAPPPSAQFPPTGGGHPVAGILLAILFGLLAAGLIALTIALMGVTLCEDQLESGCSLDSSSVHTLKVIFGWAAAVAAVVALVTAIAWRTGGSTSRLISAAAATIVFVALIFVL